MTLVRLLHMLVAAMWLGSMGYSLFAVQPKLSRMAGGDPERIEDMQRELASGNRWRVVGLIGVLWATGIALAGEGLSEPPGVQSAAYPENWLLIGVQATALAIASALFWWVSWRAWPRRVFALPDELPALQAQFRRVALVMFGLVGTAFVAGALGHLP